MHHCTLRRDVDRGEADDEDAVVVDAAPAAVDAVAVDVLVVVVFIASNISSHRFSNCNTMAPWSTIRSYAFRKCDIRVMK